MPRGPRLVLPDVALHLVQRGVNRQPCFFSEGDYAGYLGLLGFFAKRHGCSIHAYCLMTNHVHLFLTPHHHGACAGLMKDVNQRYVQRLNFSTGRSGTLWEGRFHSSVVETNAYALACYRYIELNPVRAGLAARAADYPWSSYRLNTEADSFPRLSAHEAYLSLGLREGERKAAYRALFEATLPESDTEAIRKATRGGYRVGEQRPRRGRKARDQSKAGNQSPLPLV